jgi:hypothetical protein
MRWSSTASSLSPPCSSLLHRQATPPTQINPGGRLQLAFTTGGGGGRLQLAVVAGRGGGRCQVVVAPQVNAGSGLAKGRGSSSLDGSASPWRPPPARRTAAAGWRMWRRWRRAAGGGAAVSLTACHCCCGGGRSRQLVAEAARCGINLSSSRRPRPL